jgi:ribose transport system ATP-binding protein/rhamnose transport system ATP-binding protein
MLMVPEVNMHTEGPEGRVPVREPFLEVIGLRKHFGGVQALKGVDLRIHAGEVHGLVGANGAGKSTLIRILAGVTHPDAGIILLDKQPVAISNPQHATRLGLSFIHQELNLVPKFSVIQNMTLGLPKASTFGLIRWHEVQREVEAAAQRVGLHFPLDTPVGDLSVAEQWLVSIGRALIRRARLIAMDEPTASLSEGETQRLFQIIRELAADGIGILYVSHRLEEILELCNDITVFKDGQAILNTNVSATSKQHLVKAIAGRSIDTRASSEITSASSSPVLLETRGLSAGRRVKNVSFSLHRGEVLGLAGLVGAGRTELARLLFAADQPDAGTILLDNKVWIPTSPNHAVAKGIGFVPEERRHQGLILDKSVSFNINLPFLQYQRLSPFVPLLSHRKASTTARTISNRLSVKTQSVETRVGDLSGGNQQKVVIGKWLTRDLKILILDEPSRGVDVGARAEIHKIIRELGANGVGVIVISSEVEELPGLCDRVLVMVEGKIAGELIGPAITKEAILHMCYENATPINGD